MNNNKDINITPSIKKKDNRIFLTDEEFETFKEKLEFSYYESAKLIPNFDFKNLAITNEQADQLLPFLFKCYTPFSENLEKLSSNISYCVARNHFYLLETQKATLGFEID